MNATFTSLKAFVVLWLISLLAPSQAGTDAPFTIFKRWPVAGSGEGMLIVIPPSAANEAELAALSEKLRESIQTPGDAFVLIFTDAKAAVHWHDPIITAAGQEFYNKRYVARYTRNAHTHVHEFEMFPSGIDGPSRIIRY